MESNSTSRREQVRHVIFEHDTPAAKAFDVALLAVIAFSVLLVMFESIDEYSNRYETQLLVFEWIVTALFTVEYIARLITVDRPARYARSFFGIIDLLAILPVYVSLVIPGAQSLLVIVGSTMYLIEGPEHGFDSMFRGVYWSIVTMSTVGFGDIAPSTATGQVLAALLMITGYSVIAVPTGIVSAEVAVRSQRETSCKGCGSAVHSATARFCDACGYSLG
jgi:voltage-gated potassium channel